MTPYICDLRYGDPKAVDGIGGGPFTAGDGTLVTDGVSAFFLANDLRSSAVPAPESAIRILRSLMRKPKVGVSVSFSEFTTWLTREFSSCGPCANGYTGASTCTCTQRVGRIYGVPVYGWHVRRQLRQVGVPPPAFVRLASLTDNRGQPVLQVSCGEWTYIRLGLVGTIPNLDKLPAYPQFDGTKLSDAR